MFVKSGNIKISRYLPVCLGSFQPQTLSFLDARFWRNMCWCFLTLPGVISFSTHLHPSDINELSEEDRGRCGRWIMVVLLFLSGRFNCDFRNYDILLKPRLLNRRLPNSTKIEIVSLLSRDILVSTIFEGYCWRHHAVWWPYTSEQCETYVTRWLISVVERNWSLLQQFTGYYIISI